MSIQYGVYLEVDNGPDVGSIRLPWSLPDISARIGSRAIQNARHWKRIHTTCESLYSTFRRAHTQIVVYQFSPSDSGKRGASELLEVAISEFERFSQVAAKLPKSVREAEHIGALQRVREVFGPLRRMLTIPPLSPDFRVSIETAITALDLLCAWTFETLTRADRMLEQFFNKYQHRQ